MLHLAHASHHDLLDVQDRLRTRLRTAASLEAAAQEFVGAICGEFAGCVVLSRMFATLPFGTLPEELKRKAWGVAETQAIHGHVRDDTPVLTLLSTSGREPPWSDRRRSNGHAAIPLCSQLFVDAIPMIARMLQDMGIDLGLDRADRLRAIPYTKKVLGTGWTGLFYVDDARSARDEHGRRIIPASDFVDDHNVRTVFGLGKAYRSGEIATAIVFTNTIIPRSQVEALAPLANLFKAATSGLMSQGAIFSAA